MRVMLYGSDRFDGDDKVKSAWAQACRDIGAALCGDGHTLVLTSDRPTTADFFAVEGANALCKSRAKVEYCLRADEAVPFSGRRDDFKNVEFSVYRTTGEWPLDMVQQAMRSDILVLIGGSYGTAAAGLAAPILQRPVLAVPFFGGAAAYVWTGIRKECERLGGKCGRVCELEDAWAPDKAELLKDIAIELVSRNPYAEAQKTVAAQWLLGSITALFVAWITLFVGQWEPRLVTFLLLLWVSTLAGAALRLAIRMKADPQWIVSKRDAIVEVSQAVIVAFGLALMYFVGGITINGSLTFLKVGQPEDFMRIGCMMSLLGLSASVVGEKALARLTQFLDGTITNSKP